MFSVGIRVRISGLNGRADLNEKTAKLLRFDAEASRWEVLVAGTKEQVRIKEANLTPLRPAPVQQTAKDEEADDEDCGVYVKAKLKGQDVAIDPKKLKVEFEKVVARYGLNDGDKADGIADLLCSGEQTTVSASQFAERCVVCACVRACVQHVHVVCHTSTAPIP